MCHPHRVGGGAGDPWARGSGGGTWGLGGAGGVPLGPVTGAGKWVAVY